MNREYPAVIAVVMQEYEGEQQPFRKFHRLVDVFETIIKYCAVIAIQDFYRLRLGNRYPEVQSEIQRKLYRASLGEWIEKLLYRPVECFRNDPRQFCPQLVSLVDRLRQGNPSIAQQFLVLRNQYVGHGATISDCDAETLTAKYDPLLRDLLKTVRFLTEIELLYVESRSGERYRAKRMMGVKEAPYREFSPPCKLHQGHIFIYSQRRKICLDLHPLIIYAECRENISTSPCTRHKLMFINEARESQNLLNYLDYWLGHHSRFRAPHPLPSEFLQRFPFPSRIAGSANWFEQFIRDRTAYFVGREEEMKAIRAFTENSALKALLVIGAPGMGKSTLLAKWADENDTPRHFIREGDVQTYDPVSVFRNLALQISQKYQIEWRAPLQPDPSLYREEFEKLLKRAAAKGQVVLVIDGLDEAIRAQTSEKGMEYSQTLVDWLPEPTLLPDGVRMILSTRPDLLEHRALAAKYGAEKAQHLYLSRLTDAEVRALLFQVRSKYDVLDRDDYVQAIVERSEGNPLYLRRLAEDLTEGRIVFGEVNQLPRGIVAYFDRTIQLASQEMRDYETLRIESRLQALKSLDRARYSREPFTVDEYLRIVRSILDDLCQQGYLTSEQVEAQLQRERELFEGRKNKSIVNPRRSKR